MPVLLFRKSSVTILSPHSLYLWRAAWPCRTSRCRFSQDAVHCDGCLASQPHDSAWLHTKASPRDSETPRPAPPSSCDKSNNHLWFLSVIIFYHFCKKVGIIKILWGYWRYLLGRGLHSMPRFPLNLSLPRFESIYLFFVFYKVKWFTCANHFNGFFLNIPWLIVEQTERVFVPCFCLYCQTKERDKDNK